FTCALSNGEDGLVKTAQQGFPPQQAWFKQKSRLPQLLRGESFRGRTGNGPASVRKSPKAKPKEWTDAEKRALVRLVRKGCGVTIISEQLGRYARSVRRMARELGLAVRK